MLNISYYTFLHIFCVFFSIYLCVINLIDHLFFKNRYPQFPIHLWLTMKMDRKHKLSDQVYILFLCECSFVVFFFPDLGSMHLKQLYLFRKVYFLEALHQRSSKFSICVLYLNIFLCVPSVSIYRSWDAVFNFFLLFQEEIVLSILNQNGRGGKKKKKTLLK